MCKRMGLIVMMALCLGQSCVPATPQSNRLAVTDKLREACGDFVGSDLDIETLIGEAESNLGRGVRKADYVSGMLRVCNNIEVLDGALACQRCAVAVANQVYE